jgi:ABC-type multidrug transport system ATPase subunit
MLGHNGAGKTTTLNLLIGYHKPTHGTIKLKNDGKNNLNGFGVIGSNYLDVRTDLPEIRLKMGLCQ